jgi:hypothetical protein
MQAQKAILAYVSSMPGWSCPGGAVLFDKNGEFTEVQKIVMEQFMGPRWLGERISSLMPSIQRNCKEFSVAVREEKARFRLHCSSSNIWCRKQLSG